MKMSRRELMENAAAAAAMMPLLGASTAMAQSAVRSDDEIAALYEIGERELNDYLGPKPDQPEKIALLIYPGMTVQDMVGPQIFYSMVSGAEVHLVSKGEQLEPVMGDTGFAVVPTMSMKDCPLDLDVLFVPGGSRGTITAMADEEIIEFIADRASRAKWINSVCTGSLLLGQAGLLEGKRATTHWAGMSLLERFGAIPVHERVVEDGNLVTGAGISSGLDFGLTMVSKLRNVNSAKYAQLIAEYDPKPFLNSGSPSGADPQLLSALEKTTQGYLNAARKVEYNRG